MITQWGAGLVETVAAVCHLCPENQERCSLVLQDAMADAIMARPIGVTALTPARISDCGASGRGREGV
jgi:hypothetical protein